jgi:hypothetical protein
VFVLAIGAASTVGMPLTKSIAERVSQRVTALFASRTSAAVEETPTAATDVPPEDKAAAAAPADDSPRSGMLSVFSRVPLGLYLDGRRIGTTEDSKLVLPAGRYRIEIANSEFNYRSQISVVIRPGRVTAHTVEMPTGLVQINTEPGAQVWIEGEAVGATPLAPVTVPLGTREVIVRHPQFGERRTALVVKSGVLNEVTLTLGGAAPANPYPLPSLSAPGPVIHGSK